MDALQLKQLEDQLWAAADALRANTGLKSSEYATPVLGLIFLKFADSKYEAAENTILAQYQQSKGSRVQKSLPEIAIKECGFYLPENARYQSLLNLPHSEDIAVKIKEAMEAIEQHNENLKGVLPKDEYIQFKQNNQSKDALFDLVKNFSNIPKDLTGDVFGKIYEYFLGKFALSEGQKGGEFFTPTSVVRLMVEIIEPHHGTVFDPACGSGGMFVQSQQFINQRRKALQQKGLEVEDDSLFVYGQERTLDTVKLAKMNLAVNGLRGDIRHANTYSEDPHDSFNRFDYILANPPFNVSDVNIHTVKDDRRFNSYGLPRNKTKLKKEEEAKETVPNANYLWINLFATSLKDQGHLKLSQQGRAALVMANSASDARNSEADIRKTLVEHNFIYAMLTLPSNMFYTVTLPATLWFFDKAKADDRILFIDARNVFTQIDRAHREFSEAQVNNLAMISKLHKGRSGDFIELVDNYFAQGMAQLQQTEAQVDSVAEQLKEALAQHQDTMLALNQLQQSWHGVQPLQQQYASYVEHLLTLKQGEAFTDISAANQLQQTLYQSFASFFASLHTQLKAVDKTVRNYEKQLQAEAELAGKKGTLPKELKLAKNGLTALHEALKQAELYFSHIVWLQSRFPQAKYEDVTGLCKLATPQEVAEQDYSLNAGRYVGVVIEEDGKTEEEFLEELQQYKQELALLQKSSIELFGNINVNLDEINNV